MLCARPMASAGWGEAHPFTILAAGTLLSNADAAGELIEVRVRFGQPVAIARNILTALVREVTLTIEGDALALLARADLVHLPTTCPAVMPRDMYARPLAIRHPDAAADAPWLARALMQAKTLYLAETEANAFNLTGLLVHLDSGAACRLIRADRCPMDRAYPRPDPAGARSQRYLSVRRG